MSDDEFPSADRVAGYPHPRETRRIFGQDTAVDAFLDAWLPGAG